MAEYFKRNFVVTTSGVEDPRALQYTIDTIGADRVLWAIDYPYQPQEPAVDFIDNAPLAPDVRTQVCHLNAERVFRIPALQ